MTKSKKATNSAGAHRGNDHSAGRQEERGHEQNSKRSSAGESKALRDGLGLLARGPWQDTLELSKVQASR